MSGSPTGGRWLDDIDEYLRSAIGSQAPAGAWRPVPRVLKGLAVLLPVVVGLQVTVVAVGVAGRRLWWLKRPAFSGQPAPGRVQYADPPGG